MKKYDLAVKEEAKHLRSKGLTCRAISEQIGASKSIIQLWLNKESRERAKKREKASYDANPEKHREYSRLWRKHHPEEKKAYGIAYMKTHAAEHRTLSNAWRKAHPEYVKSYREEHRKLYQANEAKRRALKAGAIIGATVSQLSEIKEIYRRAQEDPKVRCYLCGKLIPKGHRHVDHITPLSKGGAHQPSNLAIACDKCNLHKGSRLPKEVGILL